MCDPILAGLRRSLRFKAVMRGSSSSGWGLGRDRGQVGLLKRAYIKGLSRLASQPRRLEGRKALISPHNCRQDGSQSENFWGMWRGEGGCSPEGRKGQRGFLISKIACLGQGRSGQRLPPPPTPAPVEGYLKGGGALPSWGRGSSCGSGRWALGHRWRERGKQGPLPQRREGGRPQSM